MYKKLGFEVYETVKKRYGEDDGLRMRVSTNTLASKIIRN